MTEKIPLPTAVVIDPVNRCNLHCPLCPTGRGALNYPQSCMSFESFKTIIGRFPELKTIELYNWGEPFLNPEIFDMIRYTKEKKIFTQIHTNLSLKKDDVFFESLAKNSPHNLIISIDGASQDTYCQYRVGGNFNLVIENIKKVRLIQKRLNATTFIIWKFLVNTFNEHEIAKAQEIAKELGIRIRFVPMSLGNDMVDIAAQEGIEKMKRKWLPAERQYVLPQYLGQTTRPVFKGPCKYLFKTMVINPDGGVFPCCYITDKKHLICNILNEPLEAIWYNEKYTYSRSLFVKNDSAKIDVSTICADCENYEKA